MYCLYRQPLHTQAALSNLVADRLLNNLNFNILLWDYVHCFAKTALNANNNKNASRHIKMPVATCNDC